MIAVESKSSPLSQAPSASTNFIHTSINSFTTAEDNEGKYTIFNISIRTAFSSWEISKRYRQFLALHQELTLKLPGVKLPNLPRKKVIGSLHPSFVEDRKASLEIYLHQLVTIPEVWGYGRFIEFLDDSQSFLGIQVQMTRFADRVVFLEGCCASLQSQMGQTNLLLENALTTITKLEDRISELESTIAVNKTSEAILIQDSTCEGISSTTTHRFSDNGKLTLIAADDNLLLEDPGRDSSNDVISTAIASMVQDASQRPGYFVRLLLDPDRSEELDNIGLLTGPSVLRTDHTKLAVGEECTSSDNTEWLTIARSLGKFDNSEVLMSSVGDNLGIENASVWDLLFDEVVLMVQPQESQIVYRASVTGFLSKHIRKALGVHVFEFGIQALRCFVPDDPVRLSVFGKDIGTNWYVKLNEKFCKLSVKRDDFDDEVEEFGFYSVSDLSENLNSATVDPYPHSLSNISFISAELEGDHHKIHCLVDGCLGVEVTSNCRLEMCLTAFLEEFNVLIGKSHLFKRSVLLIRAWWVYEANLASLFVPEFAISILIVAIFVRHHDHLFFPLQALWTFLQEYATVDCKEHVFTMFGPIPFEIFAAHDDPITLFENSFPRATCRPVLHEEMISRYSKICKGNICAELDPLAHIMEPTRAQSCFPKRPLMIATPFYDQKVNMIADSCNSAFTQKRAAQFTEAFRSGSAVFRRTMALPESGISGVSAHTSLEILFKQTLARFGSGWRPDAPGSSETDWESDLSSIGRILSKQSAEDSLSLASVTSGDVTSDALTAGRSRTCSSSFYVGKDGPSDLQFPSPSLESNFATTFFASKSSDLFFIREDKLLERVKYCNLLLNGQISESALKILSMEILAEKGPLPVGEIGKMLQEATNLNALSSALKENFGGLKKFLEKFPEDFVLSSDHPFNPHVYLHQALSEADLISISSGGIPLAIRPHTKQSKKTCRTYASGSRIQPTRRRHSSLNDFSPQQGQSRGPPPEYFRRHNSANALIPEPQTSQMAAVGYLSSFRRTPTDPMAAAFQQTKFWS